MALYECKCIICSAQFDYVSKIADRDITPLCCGVPTTRLLSAPMISAGVWTGHKGFVAAGKDGKNTFIESNSDYNRFLKENNYMHASEGNQEAAKVKQERPALERKKRRKIIADTIQHL